MSSYHEMTQSSNVGVLAIRFIRRRYFTGIDGNGA